LRRGKRRRLVRHHRANYAWAPGFPVGLDFRQTRQRLDHRVVILPVGVGAGLAEPADRNENNVGAKLPDDVLAQAHAVDRTGSEVLHQDIGGGHEPANEFKATFRLEVDAK